MGEPHGDQTVRMQRAPQTVLQTDVLKLIVGADGQL